MTHTYPDCVNTEKAGRLAAAVLDLPLLVVLLIGGRLCLVEPMFVSADFLASDVGNLKFFLKNQRKPIFSISKRKLYRLAQRFEDLKYVLVGFLFVIDIPSIKNNTKLLVGGTLK